MKIKDHLDKCVYALSYWRFFPDLWYDYISPPTGGIKLDMDQRVFLRSVARFVSTQGVFPRGYGKTTLEYMAMVHACVFFPDIEIAMSSITKENAAKLIGEKHREIEKNYPAIQKELAKKAQLTKDVAEIVFKSGGRIDILANQQQSKGARRKRLNIEESAQMNNALFQDVLEPIPSVPRRTIGKDALVNPEEMNGQINFFTTSWFRGTDEYERGLKMIADMADLKGKMVLGADWQLAVHYGRGETKSQILEKKENNSPTFFAMNYESKWVGAVDGALVDIRRLMELRTLTEPLFEKDGKHEFILSMDVARNPKNSNNMSSIAVLMLIRDRLSGKIKKVQVVNLVNISAALTTTEQTVILKQMAKRYDPIAVVIDSNGLGSPFVDALLTEQFDPVTKESLGCWNTMNDDREPEEEDAKEILYALNASGVNEKIIVNFTDFIQERKVEFLTKRNNIEYENPETHDLTLPHLQTDYFLEEVSNLKFKKSGNKVEIEQQTKKINKDRYSAIAYGLWYIKEFEDKAIENKKFSALDYLFIN